MTTRIRTLAGDVFFPTAALAVAALCWWAVAVVGDVPAFVLPAPGAVVARLVGNPTLYVHNAWYTLEKVLYGGSVGIAAGFLLAVLVAYLPWFRTAVYPYLVAVRVLPKLAVAPLLLIYLGTGTETAVVFVALITFFPLVLSTAAGLERAPSAHRDLLRSVDAGPLERIVYVDLPYALPDVFAGLKQSVTLAVVGAVVAEWVIADRGLGFLILMGSENVRPDVMLAALAVLLALGLSLYGTVVLVQRGVRRWLGLEATG
ncbi:binding-protein-dependent transporters inner membrane component [Haloterrigena salina JCM 13891]|uniref:Binding-protein-dependent transporters inner membrane component n=1 Tax=Haloterrigena salina JCM 13891 TaxID=1227488 RepID=M0BWF3_9EURY|nr:ABC transporter permease [Haloterrigena salina]ELZ15295.1 binding-protein-dependent transporters inner membrane component [Haloterrigena salina JCM 13891]